MEERTTLGAYLQEDEPGYALFKPMIPIVHRERGLSRLDALTLPARNIYLAFVFEGEIINGGMGQFFDNSSGNHVEETLAALKTLGAELSVDLLEAAVGAFEGGWPPQDRQARRLAVRSIEQARPRFFRDLSSGFHCGYDSRRVDRDEDLHDLVVQYMRANGEMAIAESDPSCP